MCRLVNKDTRVKANDDIVMDFPHIIKLEVAGANIELILRSHRVGDSVGNPRDVLLYPRVPPRITLLNQPERALNYR